ncbi:MAG: cyclohexanone monooxygenase [Solirubrobacterales bacterium]|jgi:cation diffusion facilitator CzcD-associated flavoprotein CzcO|nr:cyclohexanone monooxygenase [Solirubrobacterales bacterium]
MPDDRRVDVVVVGAGFSGLYALYRLRELGLSVRAFEAGDGVGGTWFWNRYPGCRCDVESIDYSYSFSPELEQEWSWTERFPSQAELRRYLDHVADRFDLRRDIQLQTRVTAAHYDEAAGRWTVQTERGDRVSAQFVVVAAGCLSTRNLPDIPGREDFAGTMLHTGDWPAGGVDFAGRRVGVIGTGSSGVQVIPLIAEQAERLFVFQRTPHFVVPARNVPLDEQLLARTKADYPAHRQRLREGFFGFHLELNGQSALEVSPQERTAIYEARWAHGGPSLLGGFSDLIVDLQANDTAADFVRGKIAQTVHDPQVAARLMPSGYPLGAKRLCQGTDYYETYNRDNVTLVDLREEPVQEIVAAGLRTTAQSYELDALVFATGFDAVTGAVLAIDVRGRDGLALRDKWAHGPRAYLGVASAGFPNLFLVTGPGSPSVLSNMVVSIEQHVDWIADCIEHLRDRGLARVESTPEAEEAWVEHVGEVASATLFPIANSWYLGANIPGKPRIFLPYVGGVGAYREKCDAVAAGDYEGFALSA